MRERFFWATNFVVMALVTVMGGVALAYMLGGCPRVRTQSASNERSGQSPFSEIGVPGAASSEDLQAGHSLARGRRLA